MKSFGFLLHRLIPARAGKTRADGPGPVRAQAHPRACGENVKDRVVPWTQVGSSPRVRGKPVPTALDPYGLRLIPARAGKT